MPVIKISTKIEAPQEICFDLSRSIDLHVHSMQHTDETVIAGRTAGLIELGEEVTWQATHFGIQQTLTAKITAFDFPHSFRDEMVEGTFKCFSHDHMFHEENGVTEMRDVFDFESPLGWLGKIANAMFLTRYMTKLLQRRNQTIKDIAESGRWEEILPQRSS